MAKIGSKIPVIGSTPSAGQVMPGPKTRGLRNGNGQSSGTQSTPLKGNSASFNQVQMGVPPAKPSHPSVGGKMKSIGMPTKVVRFTKSGPDSRHSPDGGKMLSK